ncbi:MAG TPA: sigma-70 family RNA polymerase sigma factor [Polyangiaceae bacterium]|nr:sigma-70 family RNA polymerase sigma factor [Polyangiaceae bacterium]
MPRTPSLQLAANSPLPSVGRDANPVLDAGPDGPVAEKSEQTFEALFEAHFSYVWRTLARLGIREADREDLANEVFFQMHRRLSTVDFDRPLRPWIFAFAFRVASSYRRLARHRFEHLGDLPDTPDSAHRADQAMERREAQAVVDRALEALDLEQRAVFVLHEIDGCVMPEIANALGIPLSTAYSRLRLARTRFTAMVRRITNLEGRP